MTILKYIPNAITKLHKDLYAKAACGSYIIDEFENIFLDMTSGIGALSTGHSHPKVIEKVKKQVETYVHIPQQVFKSHPAQEELTYKILETTSYKNLNNIFYTNSGSESTENAIKIATKYTNKSNIVTISGGFHGRTIGALSVTSSNTTCREGVRPLLSNIYFCGKETKYEIDHLFENVCSPNDTAAILLESIQGEGGIISLSKPYLRYLRSFCDAHEILLIADEVQCGSMRTGTWWNIEKKGIRPDIMTFGKGIASGYPLAGIISSNNIMNSLGKGYLGGTYGGNAVCSAAAIATIEILNNKWIKKNVNYLGYHIKKELKNESLIREVRQYGLMIGIEFIEEYNNNVFSNAIVTKLRDRGILVLLAGNKSQYIRLLPPLNITKDEVDYFISSFKEILYNLEKGI